MFGHDYIDGVCPDCGRFTDECDCEPCPFCEDVPCTCPTDEDIETEEMYEADKYYDNDEADVCPDCDGTGEIIPDDPDDEYEECPTCEGTGYLFK